jgi:hypothetical protein
MERGGFLISEQQGTRDSHGLGTFLGCAARSQAGIPYQHTELLGSNSYMTAIIHKASRREQQLKVL